MSKQQKAKKPPKKKATLEARYKLGQQALYQGPDHPVYVALAVPVTCVNSTDVTPDTVIDRFMNDLGQESWKRRENDAVRQALIDYFVLCGYGQKWYTEAEIRQMFKELDAVGSLWPGRRDKLIHHHARVEEKYQNYLV